MRELSVKAYTASIASFTNQLSTKAFLARHWENRDGWGDAESESGRSSSGGGVSGEAQRDRGTISQV